MHHGAGRPSHLSNEDKALLQRLLAGTPQQFGYFATQLGGFLCQCMKGTAHQRTVLWSDRKSEGRWFGGAGKRKKLFLAAVPRKLILKLVFAGMMRGSSLFPRISNHKRSSPFVL
jgi:hypothetical protein